MEETLGAYRALIAAGQGARHRGLELRRRRGCAAALDDQRRRRSCRATRSLQPDYNLYDRAAFEGPLRDLCVAQDVGVIPYYGLAAGFLTGKYRSKADLGQEPARRSAWRTISTSAAAHPRALDAVAARTAPNPARWRLPG